MTTTTNPLAFQRLNVGGMEALFAPRPGSGLVAVNLLIRRGSVDESPAEHGRAAFTVAMLMRGTRRRSSRQLAFDLESLGAIASESDGPDGCALSLRVPAPQAEAALAILFEALREPAFDPGEHEIQRNELLAHLRMIEDDKFGLTYRRYLKAMFAGHGYGHPTEGELDDAQAISPDECRRWHEQTARSEACLLTAVGDFKPDRWLNTLTGLTDGWQTGQTLRSRLMDPPAAPRQSLVELTRPDLQQGFIVGGFRVPTLLHEDYPALRLASAALGEGFAGRIFTRLRDERSLAYACGAMLRPSRLAAHQVLYIGTKPETIDEARDGLLAEARWICENLLTDADLDRARQYVIGKYLMGLQSHGQRAGKLVSWEDLAGDAVLAAAYPDRLRAVTAARVRDAAARWWTQPTLAILRPEGS
jgi:zinc protease